MAYSFRLLSICPRVRKRGARLVATTAWRLRILTLGAFYRQVTVDPKQKVLVIYRRYLWVLPRRWRICFKDIEALTYSYQGSASSSFWNWGEDSVDLYLVGIRLWNGDERHLFSFYGEGTFLNHGPWPDWLYWNEYLFDLSGTQVRESRGYVELLSKMIGVTVIPARS